MSKKEFKTYVSEKGVASWPHLNSPDTQYNADGLYHTKLVFDPNNEKHAAFLAFLQEQLEAHIEGLKSELTPKQVKTMTINDIVKDELDKEGDPTGNKIVSFKMFAQSKDKKTGEVKKRQPRFFDAKGQKITFEKAPRLSGGSELKIEYSISGYNTPKGSGITLYLSNVQIVKAVEFSGGSSKFTDEGDGFTAPESDDTDSMAPVDEAPAQTDGDF